MVVLQILFVTNLCTAYGLGELRENNTHNKFQRGSHEDHITPVSSVDFFGYWYENIDNLSQSVID